MANKKSWFERLTDNLRSAFATKHDEEDYPTSVIAMVDFNDGSMIEVDLRKNNHLYVYFYHSDENVDRLCPNITEYIEDNLISWDTLDEEYEQAQPEDEWTAHGFRDEADYWRYIMGS